jgi:ribosomal protein S18 acetylase RimI-like enzyme
VRASACEKISEFQLLDVMLSRGPVSTGIRGRVDIVTADDRHVAGLLQLVALAHAQEGESWSGKPPSHCHEPITLDDVRAMIGAPRARMLAALDGEAVIGCVLVSRMNGGRSALGLLGVDSHCRRRGLGARLIAAAEQVARDTFASDQIELCVLSERLPLIQYYGRQGYALIDERRGARGALQPMAFSVMVKPLS